MNFANHTPILWTAAVLAVATPIAVQTLRPAHTGWKEKQVAYVPPAPPVTSTQPPALAPAAPPVGKGNPTPPPPGQPAPSRKLLRVPAGPSASELDQLLVEVRGFLNQPAPNGLEQQ
jgi:hypothetical protein